jgi:quercetin dioxygenase-like cupin family protein
MIAPVINIGLVANMFVRQMHFKEAGSCEQGHAHTFDHLTLLASGKLLVEANGETTEYTAPTMIYIDSEVEHKLTALEPETVAYCIHGLRDTNKSDDILSPEMIPAGIKYKQKLAMKVVANKGK